jgi:hypothetical protein
VHESAPREPQEHRHEEQHTREPAAASAEHAAPARQFEPAPPSSAEGSDQPQQRPYVVWSTSPGAGGRRED